MKILAFRITNFRSIVDTGWCRLSADNVTVLVGQNESGKSSVLEAIACTFSTKTISEDDIRVNEPLPRVMLRISVTKDEISEHLEKHHPKQLDAFYKYLHKNNDQLTVEYSWERDANRPTQYGCFITVCDEGLTEALNSAFRSISEIDETAEQESAADDKKDSPVELTPEGLIEAIDEISPLITLFDQDTLPARIDVDTEKNKLVGDGASAANNYLTLAELDLKQIMNADDRARESLLARANDKVSKEFANFWSQTIGRTSKISLACSVNTYGNENPEKVGKKYLNFWVSDGLNKLHPKQRSLGVRWFLSFYLQLRASEKKSHRRIFLLDEPGANLHSRAQEDVLRLINKLSVEIPVIYSTHSAYMLEYEKLYRVLAAQRDGDSEENPTKIKSAQELGSASTDTLSPILTAMGMNLSSQEVIKRKNNILLEEMSAFYYLKAFWLLTKTTSEAHFIAATGVNKVEMLANMFIGWGLDFITVLDDESSARTVYNSLKRNLYGDDAEVATRHMYKIKGCSGIEDIFTKSDFAEFVLNDASLKIGSSISEYLKGSKHSKPVLSYQFLLKVKDGTITSKMLNKETMTAIGSLVEEICSRLISEKKIQKVA